MVWKCIGVKLFLNITMTMQFPGFMMGALGMYKWPKRVNVPPKVLYFNVWEVYNLVYYIAFQKYLIITSLHP